MRRQSRNFRPSHQSQVNNLRYISAAHCSPLTAHCPAAFCLLPNAFCINALPDGRATAPGLLTKRACTTDRPTVAIAGSLAFTITDTAAEPASVGRSDFVSWTAIRPRACDRTDV